MFKVFYLNNYMCQCVIQLFKSNDFSQLKICRNRKIIPTYSASQIIKYKIHAGAPNLL